MKHDFGNTRHFKITSKSIFRYTVSETLDLVLKL